jgi:regulator of sirC expression with transglutaminase-like and TPR domain
MKTEKLNGEQAENPKNHYIEVAMDDARQLQFLVRLLDDDTPLVREEVLRAIDLFGPSLESELERIGVALSREAAKPIQHILERNRREVLRDSWSQWLSIREDKKRLEAALTLIVEFQDGRASSKKLPNLLDDLADQCRVLGRHEDAMSLARFLFKEKSLLGVEQEDYDNPLNSNLVYVLTEKRGLPITLACVYILVGHRLGLAIEGCNFPGHFLAIAPVQRTRVLVDCYNGGRTIGQHDLENIDARVSMRDILRLECHSSAIIARMMRNLKTAYEHAGIAENARLMDQLLESMNAKASHSPLQSG